MGRNLYSNSNYADYRARASTRSNAHWTNNVRGSVRYAASHVSPLVLDLNCDGFSLASFKDGVYFDIDNDQFAEKIGWPFPGEGQLAIDSNHNGIIDNITELFGDYEVTSAFHKLSTLDSNKDNIIDKKDDNFDELLIWQDLNMNGYSEANELKSLKEIGISKISLNSKITDEVIEGNLITEKAKFSYLNRTVCNIADIHYNNDDMNSWYIGSTGSISNHSNKALLNELNKFDQFIFKIIADKFNDIYEQNNHAKTVEEIIKYHTNEYIENYIINILLDARIAKIDESFKSIEGDINSLYQSNSNIFNQQFHNYQKLVTELHQDKQKKARDKALKDLKEKLERNKENITSKYIQELNNEIENLSKLGLNDKELSKRKSELEKHYDKLKVKEISSLIRFYSKEQVQIEESTNFNEELENQKLNNLREDFESNKQDLINSYEDQIKQEIKKETDKLNIEFKKKKSAIDNEFKKGTISQEKHSARINKLKFKIEDDIRKIEEAKRKDLVEKRDKDISNLWIFFKNKYIAEQNLIDEKVKLEIEENIKDKKLIYEYLAIESFKKLTSFYAQKHQQEKIMIQDFVTNLKESIEKESLSLINYINEQINLIQENYETSDISEVSTTWYGDLYNYFFQIIDPVKEQIQHWLDYESDKKFYSWETYQTSIEIDPETLFMPLMRGYGNLPSLHITMSINPLLKSAVTDLIFIEKIDFKEIIQQITKILYIWAAVDDIKDERNSLEISANIEPKKVAFIEKLTGQKFKQLGAANFVGQHASASLQEAWDISTYRATQSFLIQGVFAQLYPNSSYSFLEDNLELNSSFYEILSAAKNFALKHKLGYDFWVYMGYILLTHIEELNVSVNIIKESLSEHANEPIMVSYDPILKIGILSGNNEDNSIKGTAGSDIIKGQAGNDIIYAFESSDNIDGGDGDDKIYAGDGIDRIYGGDGDDLLFGENDRDFIYGGHGNDRIFGGDGDDDIEGGAGSDYLDGGSGRNKISYGDSKAGVEINLALKTAKNSDAEGDSFVNFTDIGGSELDDELIGDDQDNQINGEGGNDIIRGGKGDDNLFGAKGEDKLFGEDGDDILVGFEGTDHIDGGDGIDTVSYEHPYSTVGVIVDLSKGKGTRGFAHADTYINIENIIGSKFDDQLIGDESNNKISGGEGNDQIYGNMGDDTIIDPFGKNNLYGGDGNDYIISGSGYNECYGGNGTDTLSYELLSIPVIVNMTYGLVSLKNTTLLESFYEFENIVGTNLDDIIYGDDKDNSIHGLDGDDLIFGNDGDDIIDPGSGDDKVYGGEGNDHFMGSHGKDMYDGGKGINTVDYSNEIKFPLYINLKNNIIKGAIFALNDTLKNINIIIGTNFNDIMIGNDQNNRLFGHEGNDKIYGGEGNDILSGGNGDNELYGEDGDDQFYLHQGNNIVQGGSGTNWIIYEYANAKVEVDLANKKTFKENNQTDIFEDIHYCYGSKHKDRIIGNSEMNKLYGLDGDDYIDGGKGSDTISGGRGNNILIGNDGDDRFILDEGNNIIDGGAGVDTSDYSNYLKAEYEIIFTYEYCKDEIKKIILNEKDLKLPTISTKKKSSLNLDKVCFPFIDPCIYKQQICYSYIEPCIPYLEECIQLAKPYIEPKKAFNINLLTGIILKPNDLIDNIKNTENIIGSHYDDHIVANELDNIIDGSNGNDYISGGQGDDSIKSGRGKSYLEGGEGSDTFLIQYGQSSIDGGNGLDVAKFYFMEFGLTINLQDGYIIYNKNEDAQKFLSIESVSTSNFDDIIYDSIENNQIQTFGGRDLIYLSDGNDYVDSGNEDDEIYLSGKGEKILLGGSGCDHYIITSQYFSSYGIMAIIGDFSIVCDKIDLSKLEKKSNFESISFNSTTISSQSLLYDTIIIHIDDNKDIAIIGNVNLLENNFIFDS